MHRFSLSKFEEMLLAGRTMQEIAEEFGTTKQNVSLWKKKFFPNLSKKEYGAGKKAKEKREAFTPKNMRHDDDISRAKSLFFTRKKQNAKCGKWEFSITYKDVEWVDTCPVLGIPIGWENETRQENSPSMDRIDPKRGYVAGNVKIISWRANRIKNDGSAEEHLQIAQYMQKST